MTGMRKSGSFARKETGLGEKQSRKSGSTRPLGWLSTKMTGRDAGTLSAPAISTRRKKMRSTSRIAARVMRRTRESIGLRSFRGVEPDSAGKRDHGRQDQERRSEGRR